ncbi:MAG: Jag N-terminal domain-containing protein [Candidatus Lindowbacteria bacterium]|nr:Jag N-terminal domain-containing protein [Candidatus Lindowbacteria bacterium]
MESDDTVAREISSTEIEIEASNLEDAIAQGLARLGISKSDAIIDILDEGSKGLFGAFARKAKVRVHKKIGDVTQNLENDFEDVVQDLISGLDDRAEVRVSQKGEGNYSGEIDTEELALVLGRRGRTIDSVQTLASAILSRRTGEKVKLLLDASGFRSKRKNALIQIAKDSAKDAIASGEEIHLDSMSAFDRKIIHSTLSKESEVETSSEDRGARRHVVVRSKDGSRTSSKKKGRGGKRGNRGRRRRSPKKDQENVNVNENETVSVTESREAPEQTVDQSSDVR